MPCLNTALTRSTIKETTRKKEKKISKNKNVRAKTGYQNLKAPSDKVKRQ